MAGEEHTVNIDLQFLGAAQNVTGSKYLITYHDKRVLVDCGLYQERALRGRNWEPLPVSPGRIDAVVLTHAHLDHCGWLPRLVHQGFNGPVYCTPATAEIAAVVLRDSARLQAEDAAFKRRRHERENRTPAHPVQPLYDPEEVERTLPLLRTVSQNEPIELPAGMSITYHDAGHILGSTMVEIRLSEGSEERILLFSGDIGRRHAPILRDPSVFERADYVVMESTYGDRLHEDPEDKVELLREAIMHAYHGGGNVVIPSFAIGRTQELLYHLNQLILQDRIPTMMIFVDSPMAIRVDDVFKDHPELYDREMTALVNNHESPFAMPNLKTTRTSTESKAINHIRGTAIIIAGSGMCTGGRVKHHLVHNIGRRESTVLFVGYQAVGTLGREISSGAKEVRILGQRMRVKARVTQIHGFSAHADQRELLSWAGHLTSPPRRAFVTHGEPEAAAALGRLLTERLGWKTTVPAYGDHALLE